MSAVDEGYYGGDFDRLRRNANQLVLAMETFIYDRSHITEGGMVAAIQRFMTGQEVGFHEPGGDDEFEVNDHLGPIDGGEEVGSDETT